MMVAERLLHFVKVPGGPQQSVRVAIGTPYDMPPAEAKEIGVKSACEVHTGPVDGDSTRVYGVDKIQALSIAVAEVDMFLAGLAQQGALFWEDGEPYDPELSAPLPQDLSEAIRSGFPKSP